MKIILSDFMSLARPRRRPVRRPYERDAQYVHLARSDRADPVGGGKRMFPDGGQAPDRDARRLGIYLLIGRRTAVATGDWRRSL
jgi:hypothetical protein